MKIALINPPNFYKKSEGYKWYPSIFTLPHLGLSYNAAFLKQHGYDVDIIECPGQDISIQELIKTIETEQYTIVGFTAYFYNITHIMKSINKIQKVSPETHIILGGYYPTLSSELISKGVFQKIDCCVIGEGEQTLLEYANAIKKNRDITKIEGIAYLNDNKEVVFNQKREAMKDLDLLPFPIRTPLEKELNMVGILSSRGCYNKCSFCGVNDFYKTNSIQKIRYRTPENLVAEVSEIQKKENPDWIKFYDETFLAISSKRQEWIKRFCDLLTEQEVKINFEIEARANEVIKHKESLNRLIEVGLSGIFVGIESFEQRQLDLYKKNIKVEENMQALNILKDLNLEVEIGFMLLDPFVTIDEILNNFEILEKLKIFDICSEIQMPFSVSNPVVAIQGTPFYQMLKEKGMLARNQLGYNFVEKEIDLYMKVVSAWNQSVSKIFDKRHLILKTKLNNQVEDYQQLKAAYRLFLEKDLEFVKSACQAIKAGTVSEESYQEFLEMKQDEEIEQIGELFGSV